MTDAIASSEYTSLGLDETISQYTGSLPEDPINLESITQYLNSVDNYEGGARSELLPVTLPESDLDLNLQSISPHFLRLNPTSIAEASDAPMLFVNILTRTSARPTSGPYDIIYGKQRVVGNFEI